MRKAKIARCLIYCALLFVGLAGVARATESLRVPDLNGVLVNPFKEPLAGKERKATVLLFIAHDCPVANSYAPEIKRIYDDYTDRKIAFYIVYTEDDLSARDAKAHAAGYGYTFPALLDKKHELCKYCKATVTPEAVVLGADGKSLYRGRIDDRYIALGQMRHAPTVHDLRLTLDAILQNKPIPRATTNAIGCYIVTK